MTKDEYLFHTVVLADLHFGPRIDTHPIVLALENIVYPYIERTKPSMIVIAGDDTDDIITLSQLCARHYLNFLVKITNFKYSDGTPIPVRFINGTRSHSKNQLQSFQFLINDQYKNVKIFETVTIEDFKDHKILYIPEESVIDKYEYYKEYLYCGNTYTVCYGHGIFDFVGNNGWKGQEEKGLRGSPLWNIDDFECIKGPVIFGHVHIGQSFKNKVFYPGSLSRFSQGEENESKRFLSIYYNIEPEYQYEVKQIPNKLAPKYITTGLPENIVNLPIEDVIHAITSYVQENDIYELRYIVPVNSMLPSKFTILKKYFHEHKGYKIRFEIKKEVTDDERRLAELKKAGMSPSKLNAAQVELFSKMKRKFPEIVDSKDFFGNSVLFAQRQYGATVTPDDMKYLLGKCRKTFSKDGAKQ
jgi:hypothetical protein